VSDDVAGEGPLRGIHTALKNARTDQVVVATVDMPAIRRPRLDWIVQRLAASPDIHGVMVQRYADGKMIIEPFPLACRVEAVKTILQWLSAGNRSVQSLLDSSRFIAEQAPSDWPAEVWTNLNTSREWKNFPSRVSGG
jgi:molybdopterin-guanine dinucleotide biosynthesis protein A